MRWQAIMGVATATAGALAFSGCDDEPLEPRPLPNSVLTTAAPAISGGTLVRVSNDLFAAGDPDTDQLHFVDLAQRSVESIDLEPGDEPGRLAVGAGTVYVALRSGGALVSVDIETRAIKRLAVCPAPRGLLVDGDVVHVACATGELVTVDQHLDGVVRTVGIDRDLRDVVPLADGNLGVSVFRSAELVVVHPSGALLERHQASGAGGSPSSPRFTPSVAWRTVAVGGEIVMLHQRGSVNPVPIAPEPHAPPQSSPYGGPSFSDDCPSEGILHAGTTRFNPYGSPTSRGITLGPLVLPVDIAIEGNGYAAVASGSDVLVTGTLASLDGEDPDGHPHFSCPRSGGERIPGEPVAVAFRNATEIVVQRRQPAGLVVFDRALDEIALEVPFGGPSRRQVGHMFFHHAASPTSAVACASCHPEGREDGRVWNFEQIGVRRTQTVAGGVLDTAPLHWDGDFDSIDGLMHDVFVQRMGGVVPNQHQLDELAGWMQSIPHLPARVAKSDAVSRGEALYHDATVGCATCHNGDKLTNDQTMDVGTGKPFQVPSLVGIADRAPFMHDGCAPTLAARFEPTCGGGDLHGVTSHLSAEAISDLVAYLETL